METKPQGDSQEPAATPEADDALAKKKSKTGNGSLHPKDKKAFYQVIADKKRKPKPS